MYTLNDICHIANLSENGSAPLRHACASPRSAADMAPLPAPHAESAFDSSWEALLAGTPTEPTD